VLEYLIKMVLVYQNPGDIIYVGVLPHRDREGNPIGEFSSSVKLEESFFSRKELSTTGHTESARFAGRTFYEILKSRGINPDSVRIAPGRRTSSDNLSVVDCEKPKSVDLLAFLEGLKSPRQEVPSRRLINEKGYDKQIEIGLGILPHHVGDRMHLKERCYVLYVNKKLAHAIKEIDLANPETARANYAGKRFRRILDDQGIDFRQATILNGQRTTSEGLRRVDCDEMSDDEREEFEEVFGSQSAAA